MEPSGFLVIEPRIAVAPGVTIFVHLPFGSAEGFEPLDKP